MLKLFFPPSLVLEHGHSGRLPEEVEGPYSPLGNPVQLRARLDQGEGVAKGAPDLLESIVIRPKKIR